MFSLMTGTKMYNIMKLSITEMVTKMKNQNPNQKGKGKQGSVKKKKTTPAKSNNEQNDEEEYDAASGLVLDNEEWAFKSSFLNVS